MKPGKTWRGHPSTPSFIGVEDEAVFAMLFSNVILSLAIASDVY
jgi:hypothetical protein